MTIREVGAKLRAFLSTLGDLYKFGLRDIFDDSRTLLTWATWTGLVLLSGMWWGRHRLEPLPGRCPAVSQEIRKDYWLHRKDQAPYGVMPKPRPKV